MRVLQDGIISLIPLINNAKSKGERCHLGCLPWGTPEGISEALDLQPLIFTH